MHTFYLERRAAVGETVALPKDEAKHALKVLRLSVGDEICALDGCGGRYAAVLERAGGAVLLPESACSGAALYGQIRTLLDAPGRRERMSRSLRDMAVPDAAERIYETLRALMEKTGE